MTLASFLAPTSPPLQAAKDVVLSEKPVIMDDSASLEPLLLDKLIAQVGQGWDTVWQL